MTATKTLAGFCIVIAMTMASGCAIQPEPLTELELADAAGSNLQNVDAVQEPVSGKVSLYEAMARAVKYNLDHHVEEAEAALRVAELDLAHYNLLPNAVAKSGYAARDKFNASSSYNLTTGTDNFAASTSQEKRITSADIGFTWNILDFGLSYVRARQLADKYLIQQETRRRILHRVIEDVRTAFWRAVSAERLAARLRRVEQQTARALEDTRKLYRQRDTSPITALTYERELVEIRQKIGEIERELLTSKAQLAALMNLRPGTPYALDYGSRSGDTLRLTAGVDEMISTALTYRPELREISYQQRINRHEADAAMLELLPGFEAFVGSNYDSNSFLLNSNWVNWGAKASWNVIKVFNYPARRSVVELQDGLLHQRALAVTMAVLTQVHVSRIRFAHAQKELGIAEEYRRVQRKLLDQIRAEAAAERISNQTLVREEMNTLVAEVKYDMAYASLQNAYANLFSSMGLDPFTYELDPDTSVSSLSASLRELWFERGDMNAGWHKRVARAD